MASADYMASTSGLLECSVCMDEFNADNLPRILPCSHVYCTACLSKLARDHGGKIKCPECREEHVIMEVEKLGICLTTMKLREIKHTHRKQMEAEHKKQVRHEKSTSIFNHCFRSQITFTHGTFTLLFPFQRKI